MISSSERDLASSEVLLISKEVLFFLTVCADGCQKQNMPFKSIYSHTHPVQRTFLSVWLNSSFSSLSLQKHFPLQPGVCCLPVGEDCVIIPKLLVGETDVCRLSVLRSAMVSPHPVCDQLQADHQEWHRWNPECHSGEGEPPAAGPEARHDTRPLWAGLLWVCAS